MKTKRCPICKVAKPVSEFHKDNIKKDGLASRCKSCKSEEGRRYREANKEKVKEKDRRYKEANRKQRNRQVERVVKGNNEQSLELAHRHRLHWEDWEDEFVLSDNGLTNYQKAVKLERGFLAVKCRKRKLRKKAQNELTHDTVRV